MKTNQDIQLLSNNNIFYVNKKIIDILKSIEVSEDINLKIGEILENSKIGFVINSLDIKFELRLNIDYHLYIDKNNNKFLSLVNHEQWNNYHKYLGTYKLDNNYIWIKTQ